VRWASSGLVGAGHRAGVTHPRRGHARARQVGRAAGAASTPRRAAASCHAGRARSPGATTPGELRPHARKAAAAPIEHGEEAGAGGLGEERTSVSWCRSWRSWGAGRGDEKGRERWVGEPAGDPEWAAALGFGGEGCGGPRVGQGSSATRGGGGRRKRGCGPAKGARERLAFFLFYLFSFLFSLYFVSISSDLISSLSAIP
jgi:hypothetical protein